MSIPNGLDLLYPEKADGDTIGEMDVFILDEESAHIHYIELKNDDRSRKKDKARSQIEKAYSFFTDMNYTISATEVYLTQHQSKSTSSGDIYHHPTVKREEKPKEDISEIFYRTKEPPSSKNRAVAD